MLYQASQLSVFSNPKSIIFSIISIFLASSLLIKPFFILNIAGTFYLAEDINIAERAINVYLKSKYSLQS